MNGRAFAQATACAACAAITWSYIGPLGESEFAGGTVTGPLFRMADWGSMLFIVSAAAVFFFRRVAGVAALGACLLSLPVYLYLTAPGPFRRVFPGEYTVPLQSTFVWDTKAVAGIAAIALTAGIAVTGIVESRERSR